MTIELNARVFSGAARLGLEPKAEQSLSSALEAIKIGHEPSLPAPLPAVSAPQPEVASKTEGLWECLSRKKDPDSDGFLYLFKLRDVCDDVTEDEERYKNLDHAQTRMNALFPAIQKMGWQVLFLDPKSEQKFIEGALRYRMWADHPDIKPRTKEYKQLSEQLLKSKVLPDVENKLGYADKLRALGYGCESNREGVFLTLPDHTTLMDRWKKQYPGMAPLDLVSMEGKADAKTFISLFLERGAVLDARAEFVHDHLVHIIPMLMLLLDSGGKSYEMHREQMRDCVRKLLERNVRQAEGAPKRAEHKVMETVLSALVDTFASLDSYEEVCGHVGTPSRKLLMNLIEDPQWSAYLRKQFTPQEIQAAQASLLNPALARTRRY